MFASLIDILCLMSTTLNSRPFTALVNAKRADGYRYQDLVTRSREARSSAWFNNLVNGSSPWVVAPPSPDTWDGLAGMLGVSERHVRDAIAEEWFGTTSNDVAPEVRALADLVARLEPADRQTLTDLARRLAQPVKDLQDHLDDLANLTIDISGTDEGDEP